MGFPILHRDFSDACAVYPIFRPRLLESNVVDVSHTQYLDLPGVFPRICRTQTSFRSSVSDSTSDLRFTYCACAISTLLGNWNGVDRTKAAEYVTRCYVSMPVF